MPPIVEVPGLRSREEAEERAENFRIDRVPVDIVANDDGTFTVRATYPDGDVPANVQRQVIQTKGDEMAPIVEVPRLSSKEEADERAENFRIDDVPVDIIANADGTFTVRATYPDDVVLPGTNAQPTGS